MNQIINIDLNKHIDTSQNLNNKKNFYNKKKSTQKFFNVQFFISLIAILIIITLFLYYKFSLNNKENFSNLLINNYSIAKLYSNINDYVSTNNENSSNSIIGIIEIPKLNISYPVFNELTDELLKISPCKFYGNLPYSSNSNDLNLCIAGHNYDNDKFFSNIGELNTNDEIILYDNLNNQFVYTVIKNYEVKYNDLSPIYNNYSNSYELTLVTCNNFNKNRIIIKAKIKE